MSAVTVGGPTLPVENSLWDFSTRVYADQQIEQYCIELQDQRQANVNIMLWCCWLDANDIVLSCNILDDVLISIDSISQQTVVKLREARRALISSSAFTKVQASLVKKHILAAEIMLEKILIQKLQDMTCKFLESRDYTFEQGHDPRLDLEYYLSFLGVVDAKNKAAYLSVACQHLKAELA